MELESFRTKAGSEVGIVEERLPGSQAVRVSAWAASGLGHSLKRVGGATCQSTVQASAKVSGGSFKNLFFLFRGLVHPGHSLSYIVFPLNQ